MLSKNAIIFDPYNVVLIKLIVVIQIFQDFQLYASLVLKFLFISYNFYCNMLFSLMIKALYSLSKRTLSQKLEYLISEP